MVGFLLATCCCLCVPGFDSPQTVGPDDQYQVGVSRIDITPFYPVRLNGFGSRRGESDGTSQKLWGKALAISNGDEPPVVILAIDNLGVRQEMVDQVAAALHDKYRIPRENVALTFTHTHCAPKVRGASDTIFSSPIPPDELAHIDRYTEELTGHLITLASSAIDSRQPATLEWNVGKVGFAANRRTAGGPVDHDLPVMVARDAAGKPFAIYTSYACHCVTLSFNMYSGDWAGYAQESIEQEFPGVTALVSIGCGSDSNPVSGVTGDRVEMAQDQGQQIGAEVQRLLKMPGRKLAGKPVAKLNRIDLPLNELPTRAELEALVQAGGAPGYNASWQIAKLDRGEQLVSAIDYSIQSFSFGDRLHMLFLPGEVCVDYSLRLKKEMNRDRLWVNGYSNDFCAYIPSERLLAEGGYGGGGEISYFALPTTLKPGLEQLIIDAVLEQADDAFDAVPGTLGIPPKTPGESMSLMKTHDDLLVQLVAAEPLIADPVAIDFGSDGRLWVAEMPDYSRGVAEEFQQQGRIRFLNDDDRDGKFDRSTVFLTGLRFPTDVKVWRDGVLVCDAPDILFAADRDGDGIAEIREVVATGFATHNPHARVNSLQFGLDGWVYGSGGLFGGSIQTKSGTVVETSGRDFRFQPDTGIVEAATGQTQQSRTRDDFDNWFGCTNGALLLHYPFDERYTARIPDIAPPASIESVPSAAHGQRLFPPGNLVMFANSGAAGWPTSACGVGIYRDMVLGNEYYGDAFVCEPVNQLVHRMKLRRNEQGGFTGDRPASETTSEFLTSDDQWFRPVQVRTGTDGALYIVDMYRFVIEHPQWLTEEALESLDVAAGQNLGRIFRVVGRDYPAPRIPQIDKFSNIELARMMESLNGPVRDLAQQELVWRDAHKTEINPVLEGIARHSNWAAARVQAAATLAWRGTLPDDLAINLLNNPSREVQRAMIRITENRLATSPPLTGAVIGFTETSPPEIRSQIAFSIRNISQSQLVPALAKLATAASSPLDEYSILSSLPPESASELYRICAESGQPLSIGFCRSLIDLAAPHVKANQKLLEQILKSENSTNPQRRWQLIAHWLGRSRLEIGEKSGKIADRIRRASGSAMEIVRAETADDGLRIAAIEMAVAVAVTDSPELAGTIAVADRKALGQLLSSLHSPTVQSAALSALAKLTPSGQPPMFFEYWEQVTPAIRNEMIDRLLSRQPWAQFLVERLTDNNVRPGDLNATQRERLIEQCPEAVQSAGQLFSSVGLGDRSEVIGQWQQALTMRGVAEQGRAVYAKHCAACHVLDGSGHQVGPDLAALTNPTPQSLFVAILDPNREIDGRYLNYVAITTEGQTLAGVLTEETSTSVTLKEREGKTNVLLRRDLDEFRSSNKSMMPEGLEKDLTQEELADLLAWLTTPRNPPRSFVGNQPEIVRADSDGVFELGANTAAIFGTHVVFESESPFQNIGYWSGQRDHVVWKFDAVAAARLDVYLEYACDPGSAGNPFSFSVGSVQLDGIVESTGAWSQYRVIQIGTIETVAGENSLRVGFGGQKVAHSLLDLKRVILCETGKPPPAGVTVESR